MQLLNRPLQQSINIKDDEAYQSQRKLKKEAGLLCDSGQDVPSKSCYFILLYIKLHSLIVMVAMEETGTKLNVKTTFVAPYRPSLLTLI